MVIQQLTTWKVHTYAEGAESRKVRLAEVELQQMQKVQSRGVCG